MNEDLFITIWESLFTWNYKTKQLFELGIDSSVYDSNLYKIIINLLKLHFTEAQIDFFIWSIFDTTKELPLDNDEIIIINTGDLCWEYIQKIKEENND